MILQYLKIKTKFRKLLSLQLPLISLLRLLGLFQIVAVGDKVQDPMIHMCEHCNLPILVYGRLVSENIAFIILILWVENLFTCTVLNQS